MAFRVCLELVLHEFLSVDAHSIGVCLMHNYPHRGVRNAVGRPKHIESDFALRWPGSQ
jgi:hypothetical protein